jgi:hypothetical protein
MRWQSHEATLGENNRTIALLEFFDPTSNEQAHVSCL